MMRRVAAAMSGLLAVLLMTLLPGESQAAQSPDCSSPPCAAPTAGPVPEPVVVRGNPNGVPTSAGSGVFDRMSAGTIAPVAVTLVGLATIAVALCLTVRHRRQALETGLSAPITRLESAQDR